MSCANETKNFKVLKESAHCPYLLELNAILTSVLKQTGYSPIWQNAFKAPLFKEERGITSCPTPNNSASGY